MSKIEPFTIYNASAGSGKTFTIVKNYLSTLFQSKYPLTFKNVLALTFTNKAVGEMKARVIDTLKAFSDESTIQNPTDMFKVLSEELGIDPTDLHKKSKSLLCNMAHNYASFDISTIDRFNHKLIRTFAYDLNLPQNFEVELDTLEVLQKAVDRLIDKAGTDKELTKILVDFAIEKADEDKSWDITYDFNAIAKLLIDENEIPFIETIKDKSFDDFIALKNTTSIKIKSIEVEVTEQAKTCMELIVNHGLQFGDFSNGYLPKHFQKIADGQLDINLDLKWQTDLIEGTSLYPKRASPEIAATIDAIQPELTNYFIQTKLLIIEYGFLKNVLKNITPLSVLSTISKALNELKEEDNILLISEFNAIIGNEINKQPVPFIYERAGEKFKHYFIDEFQDTSVLQWNNLIPLIDNALSGGYSIEERGTAMLVGDAKQAIYRWRGGEPEQFIALCNEANPFRVGKTVKSLPINYRSAKTIVSFNNAFFAHISQMAFSKPEHRHIFENCFQESHSKNEGFVNLSFLEIPTDRKDELYCEKVLETIHRVLTLGYNLSDICVITRKTKEGMAIAEFLNAQGIAIVSSETLMLQNSSEVNFMVQLLTMMVQPKNEQAKIELLSYLAEHLLKVEDKHKFYSSYILLEPQSLFKSLEQFNIYFDMDVLAQSPLYETVETIIRAFGLNNKSNAYLQFFLDEVHEFALKSQGDCTGFLSHWHVKKDKLNIVSPKVNEAVQIMTIHKSKGLEFPIVIFPYANQDIYFDMNPKVWFPVDKTKFSGFPFVYVNLNKDVEAYGTLGEEIYTDYRSKLELDSINLLYVVLTRAIEQLYVISELDLDNKGMEKLSLYSGVMINYLKSIQVWSPDQFEYVFGNPIKISRILKPNEAKIQSQFISSSRKDHELNILTNAGYLWDTEQEKAIEKGNLIHHVLSHIKTESEVDFVLEHFMAYGKISKVQKHELEPIVKSIVTHDRLATFFKSNLTIYNEKDIVTSQGQIVRPDRLIINDANQVVIMDYKTGIEDTKHLYQLQEYQEVLEAMGFEVVKKILVYITDSIELKEF